MILFFLKFLSRILFTIDYEWAGKIPDPYFRSVKLGVLLNHTSLFEPIYIGVVPWRVLWRIACHGIFPGADITLTRPLAGTFYRLLAPKVVTISRQRDATWSDFLNSIRPDSVILIAPEGRMKRANGLDKDGKRMTVRGGIADLLLGIESGGMILAFSGGLHHIHTPGQRFPRFFKRAAIRFEFIDIAEYKESLGHFSEPKEFKLAVIQDLERRRNEHCSRLEKLLADHKRQAK